MATVTVQSAIGRAQVSLERGRGAEANAFVRHPDMRRARIGVGINGDRRNAHAPGRADHTARNFPAIGDQDLFKHARLVPRRRRGSSPEQEMAGVEPGLD